MLLYNIDTFDSTCSEKNVALLTDITHYDGISKNP